MLAEPYYTSDPTTLLSILTIFFWVAVVVAIIWGALARRIRSQRDARKISDPKPKLWPWVSLLLSIPFVSWLALTAQSASARYKGSDDITGTAFAVVYAVVVSIIAFLGIWVARIQPWRDARAKRRNLPAEPQIIPTERSRYPHPSYRLSAWSWLLFWLLVALPFLFIAYRIVWHFYTFSWAGIQEGLVEAKQVITAWNPMWTDGLGFMPLLGFVGFKLHGRYSLPKEQRPRIRPMYATARLCFFALSIVTMYYSLTKMSHYVDNIVETGLLKEPEETRTGEEKVRTTILAAVTSSAARRDFDKEIGAALDRGDIAHAEIYIDLADWLNINVSPYTRSRYNASQEFWPRVTRNATDCMKGRFLRNTENLTQILCIVASELTIPFYADLADLARQLIINPLSRQKTDPFIVIGAAAGRIFDRRARMLEQAASARHLRHVAGKGGLTSAVIAARYADNVDELRFAGRVANQFEKRTSGVLHLLGKRTFGLFKHYRIAKTVQLALGGWAGLWALAMTVLLSSLSGIIRGRLLRIVTLRFLRRMDERRMNMVKV